MSWYVQDSNDNNTWKGSLRQIPWARRPSRTFIGIGGAGMSGIALVLHERCTVTGLDLKSSHYVRELEDAEPVSIGHTAANY